MKKLLSILLAIAMLFSLGVSALADGDNDTIVSTESGSNSASTAVKVSYTPTSGGTTTTVEAKWGADKDHLTGSGTLAQAIAAAMTDSSIKYIQLQTNLNITVSYEIKGGVFTLDLNGKTVYASGCSAFKIGSASTPATYAMARSSSTTTSVTFISAGTVISTGAAAVEVNGGEVEIQNGSYTGDPAVSIGGETELTITSGASIYSNGKTAVENNGGTLNISGGSIYPGTQNAVTLKGGSTTVTGGNFYTDTSSTDETHASVEYIDGQLNLSGYSGVTELTVHNGSDSDVEHNDESDISLPEDHNFVDGDGTVNNTLASGSTYSIAGSSDDESTTDEAKWGADKDNLTESGTLEAAIAAANDGDAAYIRLQKDATKSDGYRITGGSFTLDLNGKTISSSEFTITIANSEVDMTFTDSSSGGKVETTESGYQAITVQSGKVTFAGGVYGEIQMDLDGSPASDANVIINGGSFTKFNDCAITNNGGKLTINGGMFSGRLFVKGTTTITGGKFSAGEDEHINYQGGTLDLSNYNGTTTLTDLTVRNSVENLTVSDSTIKLPEGYGFYKSDDTNKATVTELVVDTIYAIQSTSGGETTTVEAKWGADKDNLPNSGTLEAAIAAARTDSDVKYIQLQKNLNITVSYEITGGSFTLDLNGKTISSNTYAIIVKNSNVDMTFTDSSSGGKVETTDVGCAAITVGSGKVTFTGGAYGNIQMDFSGNAVPDANVIINGGSFTSDSSEVITNNGGTLTIAGGSFTYNSCAVVARAGTTTIKGGSFTLNSSENSGAVTLQYWSGKLDLSDYSAITDLTVYAGYAVTVSDSTIKLPSGYGFYKSDDTNKTTVTSLAEETNYAIKSTSGGDEPATDEAKWGADKDNLTKSGTLAQAIEAAKTDGSIKYIQLQTDVTATSIYDISGNITVTIDLNGHTVTSTADEAIALSGSGATTVTLKDSAGNGKVICSKDNAIAVSGGTLTIEGGSYESLWSPLVVDDGATATIEGGTFSATGEGAYVIMNDGTLTIRGGSFAGCTTGNESGAVCNNSGGTLTIEGGSFAGTTDAVITHGTTTIKGGTFAARITYSDGTLDLSGYTGEITALTVYSKSSNVTVGTDVKLPEGYGFYKSGDTDEAIVSTLSNGKLYAIKSTSGGTTTTVEAKWGASADSLPNSGTLEAAIAAANAGDAAYIQLQTDVTATSIYEIPGNITVTIDLAGHSVTNSASEVFMLSAENDVTPTVTIKDSGTTGKVETTGTEKAAIAVNAGTLTIEGGSYAGTETALLIGSANETANVTIENGTFSATENYKYAIKNGEDGTLTIKNGTFTGSEGSESKAVNSGGVLTIEGGTFTGDECTLVLSGTATITGGSFSFTNPNENPCAATIQYWSGKLDLSDYSAIADLTVYAGYAVTVSADTIKLPDGYGFYAKDDEDKTTVTELEGETVYAIQSTSGGTTTDTATITGVTVTVGGTTYTSGQTVTLTADSGNVTITVKGTNFAKLSSANAVLYAGNYYEQVDASYGWAIDTEANTASCSFPSSNFVGCSTAAAIKYANDSDGSNATWIDSGIKTIYQGKPISVDITWPDLAFTYSDETSSWSGSGGSDSITVQNVGSTTIRATMSYAPDTAYSSITGKFVHVNDTTIEYSSATLTQGNTAAFKLVLTGKPTTAVNGQKLGEVTVTITEADT